MNDVNAINSTQAAVQAGAAPVQQQKEQAPPPPPTETDSVEISQEARNASSSAPQPSSNAEDTFEALS